MPASTLLAVAVGILVGKKQLLVEETPQGHLVLPGFAIGKARDVLAVVNEFLLKHHLNDLAQQSLYLSSVRFSKTSKTKATGLARIVHFSREPEIAVPDSRYVALNQLQKNEQSAAFTRAVTQWLIQTL